MRHGQWGRAGLAAGVAVAILGSAFAAQATESRYTRAGPGACTVAESGEPEGQDWLLYRCEGQAGMPVWLLYQDSTRLQAAFGPRDFTHYAAFSSDRDEAWQVEWRGVVYGRYRPFAAILRMRPVGEPGSILAVYRIWPDKPSCLIGQVTDNAEARRIADAASTLEDCPS